MDGHTKQVFYAGLLAYASTVGGLILSYTAMKENHEIRITHMEKASYKMLVTVENLTSNMVQVKTENENIGRMIGTLESTVSQIGKATTELRAIAARLDERSKN